MLLLELLAFHLYLYAMLSYRAAITLGSDAGIYFSVTTTRTSCRHHKALTRSDSIKPHRLAITRVGSVV